MEWITVNFSCLWALFHTPVLFSARTCRISWFDLRCSVIVMLFKISLSLSCCTSLRGHLFCHDCIWGVWSTSKLLVSHFTSQFFHFSSNSTGRQSRRSEFASLICRLAYDSCCLHFRWPITSPTSNAPWKRRLLFVRNSFVFVFVSWLYAQQQVPPHLWH